ncbi:MAG: 4'-phosphopantetheinyl transferase superfamily protein [Anaerobiospirillum succiniciproducens]|uniref:4'-phosphopantetheinyl transferase family protein n=1 Tax=Anaerobiospirillum succiniciproducens TaxID=13335 RepID=UPI0026DCE3FC|nr:4'-phosphopantetheinyl transferase superfamily protein [Anaerobiospirillum succiniciproducens]MDO4676225.1 4'-phosphopantetheinyl transferase superfamily protein [Anaerobiospirillum succiniciproducens]
MKQTQLKIAYVSPASPCIHRLVAKDEFLLNSASSFKPLRRKTYLSGRGLLKLALVEQGLLDINAPLPPLMLGPSGKPFIGTLSKSVNEVHFNLSHSIDLIALSTGSKEQGIDLEVANIKRLRKPLVERVLSDKELDYYLKLESDADKALFFTQQWTLREALIKLTGLSIFKMDVLSIDPYEHTIVSSEVPKGVVYCFKLPKAAGSSKCVLSKAMHDSHPSSSKCVLSKAMHDSHPSSVTVGANCGLDEPLEINLNEPLDAMVSVFVHQEDIEECQKARIAPVLISMQQELATSLGLLMDHDGAQEAALNGAINDNESMLYDHTDFIPCALAVYNTFTVNCSPDS